MVCCMVTKGTLKTSNMYRAPDLGLVFHSDNGSNFTSYTFTKYLNKNNIKQSFSRVHNPYDNSVCEAFFKSFKQEEIYRKDYASEKEMLRSITRFMELYNNERPHKTISYRTPSQY